jgi:hypothetical protein
MMYLPLQEVYPVIDVCAEADQQAQLRIINTAAER